MTADLGTGKNLEHDVVRQAFLWALENDVPLQGFTGDDAVTLRMEPELEVCPGLACLPLLLIRSH